MEERDRRVHAPDEAPDVAQLVGVKTAEPTGEVVGDSDVVCIEHEVSEGDMDGEEGGGEEEPQEQGMGHGHPGELMAHTLIACLPTHTTIHVDHHDLAAPRSFPPPPLSCRKKLSPRRARAARSSRERRHTPR